MQNTATPPRESAAVRYRERLTPSLWVFGASAVLAPMAALVLTPVDATIALVAGVVLGVVVIALLVASSPVVEVTDAELRAGRARIEVHYLGAPEALTGEEARQARGPALDPRAWHLIRGGMEGLVIVAVTDQRDATPFWVISSRTPDRLASAIMQAQRSRSSSSAGP